MLTIRIGICWGMQLVAEALTNQAKQYEEYLLHSMGKHTAKQLSGRRKVSADLF